MAHIGAPLRKNSHPVISEIVVHQWRMNFDPTFGINMYAQAPIHEPTPWAGNGIFA